LHNRLENIIPNQSLGRSFLRGAKGVGELGTIGATPAVVNAVVDALASARRSLRSVCGGRWRGTSGRRVSEVIGPVPQIAPKKHCVLWLWQGGMRRRARPM
jgi:hypothetical protein